MTTYFKAVRPAGTDFYTGTVQWAPPDGVYPHHVQHPTSTEVEFGPWGSPNFSTCLSVSSEKANCIGFEWPARLLAVEAPDAVCVERSKYACISATVTGELPAHELFGPQGEHVARFLDALKNMTLEQADQIEMIAYSRCKDAEYVARVDARAADRYAAHVVARAAVWYSARFAARAVVRGSVWRSAGYAAAALVVRDLLPQEPYDEMTRSIRLAGFTVHPDDKEL